MTGCRSARSRASLLLCLGLAASLLGACDVNRFAANQTVKVIEAGALGGSAFWDYEVAGQAMPSAIMQGEMLMRVTPENEQLLLGMARTYISYGYGWLQLDWEKADLAGDFETADALVKRIRRFYVRAHHLALKALKQHDGEGQLAEVLATRDAEKVTAYVKRAFDDVEDVPLLYWTGLAWGSVLASPGSTTDELADAPLAVALIQRSIDLDPSYQHGGGYSLLAAVEAAMPELFGGDLEKARGYFEKAIEIGGRKDHLTLVGFARGYAVAAQNRQLFVDLLREVISAPDQGDEYRLANKVALQRARFYLEHVDNWFLPAEP